MTEKSPATRDELMLLYRITISDLAYFKAQQWSVTNYAFLLMAGVVGLWELTIRDSSFVERVVLVVLAIAIATASLIILTKLQVSIGVRQSRLNAVREHFSLEFYEAWSSETKAGELVHSIWFLRSAIVVGAIAVAWLLLR